MENYMYKINPKYLNFAYRTYNAGIASLVLYQYYSNPTAEALEYLPDIGIHAFEAVFPNTFNNLAISMNFARGIQSGAAFYTGISTIPHIANGVDILNHLGNIGYRVKNKLVAGNNSQTRDLLSSTKTFTPSYSALKSVNLRDINKEDKIVEDSTSKQNLKKHK